jgi:hypothetical protein
LSAVALPSAASSIEGDQSGCAARGDVLVSRRSDPFVGWVPIDEFENLFSDLGNARIVVPHRRKRLPGVLDRTRNRMLGDVAIDGDIGSGEILFIVARTPTHLQAIRGLKHWRKRFRYVVGYVIDAYFYEGYSSATRHFDHVFATTAEGAEHIRKTFGVSSSVLHQGFDCLNWASVDADRSIDLLGFGRQPPSYHKQFQQSFHQRDSGVLYLHSPIGTVIGPGVWAERPMMLKLMQRSKISLAFHLLVEPQGDRPKAMFVTSRWFEQLATGSLVVGKRTLGEEAAALFDWPDATIELSDDPAEAAEEIASLAKRTDFLAEVRRRNVVQMCRRHDWRYRLRDVYNHFGLSQPERLTVELSQLDALVRRLEAGSNR